MQHEGRSLEVMEVRWSFLSFFLSLHLQTPQTTSAILIPSTRIIIDSPAHITSSIHLIHHASAVASLPPLRRRFHQRFSTSSTSFTHLPASPSRPTYASLTEAGFRVGLLPSLFPFKAIRNVNPTAELHSEVEQFEDAPPLSLRGTTHQLPLPNAISNGAMDECGGAHGLRTKQEHRR